MSFSLTQLETFRLLAREGNFTRAAERLNLTQPAVTQHVRALADHFGVKLVDVVGRKTVLTDAGRFLAARSEALLGNVEALERDMREFADVAAGELRIGATVTIGTYALPDLLAHFRAAYPAIRLVVEVANTEAMGRAVKAGQVSLALVEGPLSDAELAIEAYARDELVLIVPNSHAFAGRRRPIAPQALATVPFIFREVGSGTRFQVERELSQAGVAPDVVLTLPTGEGIVRAVELGIGVAVVSRLIADGPLRAGRVAHASVIGLDLKRTFRVVRLKWQTLSPAAAAFMSLVRTPAAKTSTA